MPLSDISPEEYDDVLREMRSRVKRAFLTGAALSGERRLGFPTKWALGDVVRDFNDAYGYTVQKRKFIPTPKDVSDFLPVMGAIAHYRTHDVHGKRDFKILFAKAFDMPTWRLADQFGASERTIQRWQDVAVEKILNIHLTQMSDKWQKSG